MSTFEDVEPSWRSLHDALVSLRGDVLQLQHDAERLLARVHETQRTGAENLLRYVALRRHDLSKLQAHLSTRGLSSLGRSESHVLGTLDAVIALIEGASGMAPTAQPTEGAGEGAVGRTELHTHATRLWGAPRARRDVRIMVTLPSAVADDPALARELLERGMDCARINGAHDEPDVWRRMARHVREAAHALGQSCSIAVDLPGPKCRTGALLPGPAVRKLKPQRGPAGEVLVPAQAWLVDERAPVAREHTLPVPAAFLASLEVGETLTFTDARGRRRTFEVTARLADAAEIRCDRTAYVLSGATIQGLRAQGQIGQLPALELAIRLRVGDPLVLTRAALLGAPAVYDASGGLLTPAHIACEPPELIAHVKVGERVLLDDGKIVGVVEATDDDGLLVRVTAARPEGAKLRAGKGINVPDSRVELAAFSSADVAALDFAVEAADIVSLSFVRAPADVHALQDRLATLGRLDMGVILKIETRDSFQRLPELLLAVLRSPRAGVMIARGDLAVECGFERMAELQEEILWLCEAAHVPVVWATQVLETLAKSGRPTRAEVTDAAMAVRAECVMLNKGPYIAQAVSLLDDIMQRMSAHQDKKRGRFRALEVARSFAARVRASGAEREL